MKNFLLNSNPNFGEVKTTLKDESKKFSDYTLQNAKNDRYVFMVTEDGMVRDHVIFTRQDLKALYCLLSTECK